MTTDSINMKEREFLTNIKTFEQARWRHSKRGNSEKKPFGWQARKRLEDR